MIDDKTVEEVMIAKGLFRKGKMPPRRTDFLAAGRQWLRDATPLYNASWGDSRVRLALDQLIMTEAGIDAGAIDGVEGVMTQFGWEQFQNKMRRGRSAGGVTRSSSAFCRQSEAAEFYGQPGTNHTKITPPYKVFYGDQAVRTITINVKCAQSASRAMQAVLDHYGFERIHQLGLNRYGGCYNNRVMRGGTKLSMHAFACAIDWDPVRNTLRADHRTAQFARLEYAPFLDAWEAEGWTSLGRSCDFDWMHVQAATL